MRKRSLFMISPSVKTLLSQVLQRVHTSTTNKQLNAVWVSSYYQISCSYFFPPSSLSVCPTFNSVVPGTTVSLTRISLGIFCRLNSGW